MHPEAAAETIQSFATAHALPFEATLDGPTPLQQFLDRVPIGFARRHGVLGLEIDGTATLAISRPAAWPIVDVLRRLLRRPLEVIGCEEAALSAAINRCYQQRSGLAAGAIERVDRDQVLGELISAKSGNDDLLDVAARAPVIQVVNLVLFEAVQAEASDVHFQPTDSALSVRYRIDGILHESFSVPKAAQSELISRIKVMGQMNVAETRLPQDGRATVKVGNRSIDLRISTIPTSHGERAVIRLLDKSARLYRLSQLGMDEQTLQRFRKLVAAEHGLLLVTGPTGSGKTTTLYAAIQELDAVAHNILTIEDPIEYELDGISQTPVATRKGMTFASALRNVLRQDPDVIMVGEIRDAETAHMAIQAALTGHLVLSTLHTNDAASAITRLLDLGIEPFLLSSCLIGVVAQRLIRRVCDACAREQDLSDADRALFTTVSMVPPKTQRHGVGCQACRGTGYRSRSGIFEVLLVNRQIAAAVSQRTDAAQVRVIARRAGALSMLADGLRKVAMGVTTCADVASTALVEDQASGDAE